MLEKHLEDVQTFHQEVTKQPVPAELTMLVDDRRDYAIKFLDEELTEFKDAACIADQADALVDMIYVAYGRLLEMGITPGPAFKLVHEANMKKVRGKTKRDGAYDAAKPEGWTPPDWEGHLGIRKGQYIGLTRTDPYLPSAHENLDSLNRVNPFDNSCVPKKNPKILLLGYGRHGKDTVAEMLRDGYNFSFTSSSMACAEKVMMPYFTGQREEFFKHSPMEGVRNNLPLPPLYKTAEECFNDRHNHRAEWFKAIEAFNSPDKAGLGKMIFEGYDIYCGLRSAREFAAVTNAGLYDYCIWVDALQRHPAESRESCTVEPWMADYILDNNGTLEELEFNFHQLMSTILGDWHA